MIRSEKPYAMLGAGKLAASLWKLGDEAAGWRYRFNIFQLNSKSGRVSQRLAPSDVGDLVKLAQILAATLADDGCLSAEQRRKLADLAMALDGITDSCS